MEINYKGVLCRLGTYRVIGEDKPTLYYISAPDDETMYKAGFEELHYGLWGKILTDEEYKEITNIEVEKELNTLSNELISKMKKISLKEPIKSLKIILLNGKYKKILELKYLLIMMMWLIFIIKILEEMNIGMIGQMIIHIVI